MRFLAIAAVALMAGLFVASPSADAAGFGVMKQAQSKNLSGGLLVPVYYGRGRVIDRLLDAGYERIRLVKTYHRDYGDRVFKFKACRDGLIYYLRVDSDGYIRKKVSRGLCMFRIY